MPASAVIPAPGVSMVVAAVKVSVVGLRGRWQMHMLEVCVSLVRQRRRSGQGPGYWATRGEIRGLAQEQQRRRRWPGANPVIKDVGQRIEDD